MAQIRISPGLAASIRAKVQTPLARDMMRRGLNVESAAKRRIGQYPRRIDTGRLRSSISTAPIRRSGLPGAQVGSGVHYALYVHNGTRYMIANPYLRDALPAARL